MSKILQSRNVVVVFTTHSNRKDKRLNIPAKGNVLQLVDKQLTEGEARDLLGVTQNGKWID